MKVGIIQVDGKYPNLALMQITAYHEKKGDQVEWYRGNLFSEQYDKIYASKIFSFSTTPELPEKAVIGGTGINFTNRLPEEISEQTPSYSLYPDCNFHIGFSMKGCRFNCKFCCVPQKEGRPVSNSDIDGLLINPNGGNRLMLLDNDFFGNPNWKTCIERIIELKLKVNFNQGLNIRIITQEQAEYLSQVNFSSSSFSNKYVTFAWDRFFDRDRIMKGIEIVNKAGISNEHLQFFVLIGFDTTPSEDLERVMTLKNIGSLPFVMPYNKKDEYQKSFARWVNNRAIFNTVEWKDYNRKLARE